MKKNEKWKVVWKDPNELTPYQNNARLNDGTVPFLVNSIKRFGFRVPLVIDKDGVVVCGHTRLKAVLEIGMDKVPCVVADDLTPAELKAFRLADNKIQEMSEWDFDKLGNELKELKNGFDGDMDDFGFKQLKDGGVDDLFDPNNQAQPKEKVESDGTRVLRGICPCCGEEYEVTVTADNETKDELTPKEGEE